MPAFSRLGLLLCLFTVPTLPGCVATIAGSDESADGATSGDDGDSWTPCTADNPCPDGQFCFNGLCAVGCQSDGDCADNQYCDTDSLLCQNQQVPTCTGDGDCASSQICVNSYCTTPPVDVSCDPDNYLEDGCDSNAICLEDVDGTSACYTMPACNADGSCPVGLEGAVCNDGYLSVKDRICLIGLCEDTANCPADYGCVRLLANSPLGLCSNGGIGAPCADAADCTSGMCTTFPGFDGGFCQ